ncbi:MAG: hypothetical protein WC101_03920 [Candidatus Gracilibacteria bacterium]
MNKNTPQSHSDVLAVSPVSGSRPGLMKKATSKIVALGLSTIAAIGATGCVTNVGGNGGSGYSEACSTAEHIEPIKTSIHKFTYESEYLYDPVEGIKINLDIDVGGITSQLKETCGGQPQVQLFGTIHRNYQGVQPQQGLLSAKGIDTDGRQHLEVSLDGSDSESKQYNDIYIDNFEIRITGPGGNPVFKKFSAKPKMAQM